MVDNSVLKRIKALLNRTVANGCTEVEAAVAAEKAQHLLITHNISMRQLDVEREEIGQLTAMTHKRIIRWKVDLLTGCAKANFCKGYVQKFQGGASIFLVGTETNRLAALDIYEYLEAVVDNLALTSLGQCPRGESKKAWAEAFRVGCSMRLKERLTEATRKVEAQGIGSSTAIVVADAYKQASMELARYFDSKGMRFRSMGAGRVGSGDGFAAGRNAAEGVNLNQAPRIYSGAPALERSNS